MINRILVALDLDLDTPLANRYAIKLAKKFDASVSGLAVVDTVDISHTGRRRRHRHHILCRGATEAYDRRIEEGSGTVAAKI
ncbi:MAG: hypothetical protein ACNS64_03755 [Candidatus Halalkalibacterium sp. M3_1C_030]